MSLKKEKWVEKMCPVITFCASVQDHYVKSKEKGFQMFRDLTMSEDSHQWISDKNESLFIGAFC